MDICSIRKTAQKIKGQLFKNSNSYSIGMLKSHFRGTGLMFKEHQVYGHGDDVRFIDWKMLAKTGSPYIKTFEEERNVEIVAVIDAGPSMLNGENGISKLQASIEICCLLYILAKETGDHIHALILTDEIIDIPKMSGDQGIIRLVAKLEEEGILDSNGAVNIMATHKKVGPSKKRYISIMKHLSKMREVVLLSDFHNFLELDSLKRIIHRRNIHCFRMTSSLDQTNKIPFSFLHFSSSDNDSSSRSRIPFDGIKQIDEPLGPKVKKINIGERYLEAFIKEML